VSRRTFLAGAGAAFLAACGRGRKSPVASRSSTTTAPSTNAETPSSTTTLVGGPARYVPHGPREGNAVALTFHGSGDHTLGLQLLDAAAQARAPITVFAVGTWLEQEPDMARRILDGGHELANHTYTHPTFPTLSRADMQQEIERCRDVLQRIAGSAGDFFRPSGTSNGTDDPSGVVHDVAHAAGYDTLAGFDVDPMDYDDPGASTVAARTLAAVHPGAIVSLHFGHAGTIEAMPAILGGLDARGMRPVTLRELLGG